jgi:serine protease Do
MLTGVAVTDVARGSPADQLGFQPGDMLLEINGRSIDAIADLKQVLVSPPNEWALKVGRGGRVISVRVRG